MPRSGAPAAADPPLAEAVSLLRELVAEQRATREALEGLRADLVADRAARVQAPASSASDERELAALLPKVFDRYGSEVWCVSDLAVENIVARDDTRSVGRLLARNDGVTCGDLRLHGVGADRDGRMWVLRVLNR